MLRPLSRAFDELPLRNANVLSIDVCPEQHRFVRVPFCGVSGVLCGGFKIVSTNCTKRNPTSPISILALLQYILLPRQPQSTERTIMTNNYSMSLALLSGVLCIVSITLTSVGYATVMDLETAEKDNMLRFRGNVTDSGSGNNYTTMFELTTGVLSQATVDYSIYQMPDGTNEKGTACKRGKISGSSDRDGWNALGGYVSVALGSTAHSIAEQSLKNLFAPTTYDTNFTMPGALPALEATVNGYLTEFVSAAAAHLTLAIDYDAINGGADAANFSASIGTCEMATGTGDDHVQGDKVFLSMLHWHGSDKTPKAGSDTMVFGYAVRAVARSIATGAATTVDSGCFLDQYRDDVQLLIMNFDELTTWAGSQIGVSIIVSLFIVAVIVAPMWAASGMDSKANAETNAWAVFSLIAMVLVVGYFAAMNFRLRHQIKAVVDGVENAIPSSTACASEHIEVVYDSDDAPQAEMYYLISAWMMIVAGALALLAIILSKYRDHYGLGGYFSRFD
jgi:hypothetical protein